MPPHREHATGEPCAGGAGSPSTSSRVLAPQDLLALRGLVNTLHSLLLAEIVDSHAVGRIRVSLGESGLLAGTEAQDPADIDIRQALEDLFHRLLYVLGETDEADGRHPVWSGDDESTSGTS